MENFQTNINDTVFKIGDKVRLKADATNWGKEIYGKEIVVSYNGKISETSSMSSALCVTQYPDDFELVEEEPKADPSKRHIHHDMIVEWAKYPSRVVQWRHNDGCSWKDCSEDEVHPYPVWDMDVQYRFKPTEPERVSLSGVFPETSLTVDELLETYEDTYTHREGLVAVANAAIKQYILDTEKSDD